MKNVNLMLGDCLEKLKAIPNNSIDSVITDPPYGLGQVKDLPGLLSAWMSGDSGEGFVGKAGFMNKGWDKTVPPPVVWRECLRVLKPGGYMLVFAGTRTQDLMGISIRLGGFDLRDEIAFLGTLHWVYGSGFPKSLDVSKAIDKEAGAEREVVGKSNRHVSGKPEQRTEGLCGSSTFQESIGMGQFVTAPSTPGAKKWEGFGTALKPAHEPILLFRKPLDEKTVAKNVLKHGTGGLNIDGCRVNSVVLDFERRTCVPNNGIWGKGKCHPQKKGEQRHNSEGRWPANLIHDGSDEVVGCFPGSKGDADRGSAARFFKQVSLSQEDHEDARRFVYIPKASKKDRNEGLAGLAGKVIGHNLSSNACGRCGLTIKANGSGNKCECGELRETIKLPAPANFHPTVKPTDLMRYLCRLVTPPGGTVLDPFMGSGSTGKGAILEGFDFVGIELEEAYFGIAEKRINKTN